MNKEEILNYVYANSSLPEEVTQYYDDIDFIIEVLETESSVMFDLAIEVQRKVLLINDKYIEDANTNMIFNDENFAKELLDRNIDILLKLRDISVGCEYIKNLTIAYIKGEIEPISGAKLEKMNARKIYMSAVKEVKDDHDLAIYMVQQDINMLPYIKDNEVRNNPQYIIKYIKNNPQVFPQYINKFSNAVKFS